MERQYQMVLLQTKRTNMKYCINLFVLFLLSCSCNNKTKEYYSSGELKIILQDLEGGLQHYKEFHKNGVLKQELYLENGYVNGDVNSYYDNGKLQSIHNYSKGIQDSIALFYSENGDLYEKSFISLDSKYYSIFYDPKNDEPTDLIRPITKCRNEIRKDVSAIIEVNIPFEKNSDFPFSERDISILWDFSKSFSTSQFSFDESKDSVITLNKKKQSASVTVTPRDTGTYYMNQLVYFNMKDSMYDHNAMEFYVK